MALRERNERAEEDTGAKFPKFSSRAKVPRTVAEAGSGYRVAFKSSVDSINLPTSWANFTIFAALSPPSYANTGPR